MDRFSLNSPIETARPDRDEDGRPVQLVEEAECGWCGDWQPVAKRLPEPTDGEALCTHCYTELSRETAGFPDCGVCLHRYYVKPLGNWGFRCGGCGTKFTRFMADSWAEERRKRAQPEKPHAPLFAPQPAAPLRVAKREEVA